MLKGTLAVLQKKLEHFYQYREAVPQVLIQHSNLARICTAPSSRVWFFFVVHLERFAEVGGGFGVVCSADQGALQMAWGVFRL